jgi:hypothetical protein
VSRGVDRLLAATLIAVPLAFDLGVREFGVFKELVLGAGAGAAAATLALAGGAGTRAADGRWLWLAIVHVLLVLAWRPSFGAAEQAAGLVALALLAWMLAQRVPHWSSRRVGLVLGVPLLVDLAWSWLQCAEVGVLPATAAAFGTTHGVAVGTIGNPNENCWYLVLAGTLLLGTLPERVRQRKAWIAALAIGVGIVIVVDRSRAVGLAVAAGLLAWRMLEPGWARRHTLLLGLAASLVALGLGLWWGGAHALDGRAYLAHIELGMLAGQAGAPAGLGRFAPDFEAAQAVHLATHPEHIAWLTRLDHAHADLLELVYELGVPALAWIVALAGAVWRARRRASPLQRAAIVCLAEGAVLSLSGYPLFSPACAVVLALALAIALPRRASIRGAGTDGRLVRVALLVLGALLVVVSARRYQAEHTLTRAWQAAYEGDEARARTLLRQAQAVWPVAR